MGQGRPPVHHVLPAGDAEERVGVAARAGHDQRVPADDEQHAATGKRRRGELGRANRGVHLRGQPLPSRGIAQRRADHAGCPQDVRDADDRQRQHRHPQVGDAAHRRKGAAVGEPEHEVGAQPQHHLRAGIEEAAHAREGLHFG